MEGGCFFASHLALRDDGCRHVGRCMGGNSADVRGNFGSPTTPTTSAPTIFTANHLPIRLIQTMLHHESKDTAPRALRRAVHSFAHYGTTAMQVTINAQLQLMIDRHSNSSREREKDREKEREREREREREPSTEREKEPSTGKTSQGSKGTSFQVTVHFNHG